jgi:Na+/melibiose symporter-like transporter
LTTDYNERTSLATTRMVFSVVGYISGAALTTLLAAILRDSNGIPIRRLGAKSV